MTQGTSSISTYYSKLKELGAEFESLVPPNCNCDKSQEFLSHLQRQKLYQFFMGLNEIYNQVQSQILLMTHLPNVNQAYSMLMNDESQKVMNAGSILGVPPVHNTGNISQLLDLYSSKPDNGQRFKKNYNLHCEVCKMKNQTKENCYKVIGYPSNRFKKKGWGSTSSAYNVTIEN
ncbi:hypothetical protein K7X08_000634 [Anisodus acutangulus]|uniref:Retrotransposon gag domain-containing protein n=1 Tax=Anisodus acutangulus TaxID=402998 RepID=A0A9Q1M675_9SOLA|nr:hypothetical protein K7X08_000634 [Anisodus acutangulus]